jgi:hypothetical protein
VVCFFGAAGVDFLEDDVFEDDVLDEDDFFELSVGAMVVLWKMYNASNVSVQ